MIYTAIEYFFTVLTLVSVLVCLFKAYDYRVAAALLLNLLAAGLSSECGNYLPIGLSLFISAAICVVSFRRGDSGMLDIECNEVGYAIAFILMLRMPFVILHAAGVIGLSYLWLSAIVFLLFENMLILGGHANGNATNINNNITDFRVMFDEIIFARCRV